MTDDALEQIAHDLSGELLRRVLEAGGTQDEAMLATECLHAYVLSALVLPGHDPEVVEDAADGIAQALVQARMAGPVETRH